MIIVITNRALPDTSNDQVTSIAVNDMGVTLAEHSDNKASIRAGVLSSNYQNISFQPVNHESDVFSKMDDADKYKPWIFFVHGFHQDPKENMAKAKALYKNHGVNVIAFAWPSRPLDEEMSTDELKSIVKKDVLTNALGVATLGKIGLSWMYKSMKDTWTNYEPARKHAESSNVDLIAAMKLVDEHLPTSRPPVLIVHSMGNYLLKSALTNIDKLPITFSNIILHQPDVNSQYHGWVKKLKLNLSDTAKLYITINAFDYVLGASNIRREIKGVVTAERLGQTRQHYIVDHITYLDFTDAEYINNQHEIFVKKKSNTNDDVYDCLGRIFRAELDLLPIDKNESHAGFSRMPTDILLYQLEEIVDPIDGEEAESLVSSLSWFEDPLTSSDQSYSEEEEI